MADEEFAELIILTWLKYNIPNFTGSYWEKKC
jgi:hypothetical protein